MCRVLVSESSPLSVVWDLGKKEGREGGKEGEREGRRKGAKADFQRPPQCVMRSWNEITGKFLSSFHVVPLYDVLYANISAQAITVC